MNVVFVLTDSLNRHFLSLYGNDWVKTPNISRLAERGVAFEQHYTGSAPCMPARRELWTGNHEFPWRPWGCRELFDEHLALLCRQKKIPSHMVTDHYHYWEEGGTGYHTEFEGCDMIRGQEYDYWCSDPCISADKNQRMTRERYGHSYRHLKNASLMKKEEDFSSPKTFATACEWLDRNHAHGPFFLAVECFDPHEPFHVPPPYDTMYGEPVENETYWPLYGRADRYEPKVLERIRQFYAGQVTMLDTWLGRLLDRLDKYRLWDDTLVVFTTDHGHYLGEHNALGKPHVPPYQTLFNIPLIIHLPGGPENKRSAALSTAVDLPATCVDALGLERKRPGHGRSLLPILRGEKETVRDKTIMGYWGKDVGLTDGRWKLLQPPVAGNRPLSLYGIDIKTMRGSYHLAEGTKIGRFIPHAGDELVLQIPQQSKFVSELQKPALFDLKNDPGETHDLFEEQPETAAAMQRKLVEALQEIGAPAEHLERLGLA